MGFCLFMIKMNLIDIKKKIGKPTFETDDFVLYNMDCIEGMSRINEEVIDLTVTSPPYNIGKEYEEVKPLDKYLSWTEKWVDKVYSITKPAGAFLFNLGYLKVPGKGRNVPLPYMLWDKTDFYLIQEIVWNYGAGVSCRKILSPRNEKYLWYVKDSKKYTFNLDDIRDPNVKYPNQKKNGKLRCNSIGKNPSDVWRIAKVTSGKNRASKERRNHPAQFPADVIERVIKGFSNPGDIVLDPFMGSGTVAEVALKYNRKCIGFEINSDYCEIIKDRVKNVLAKKNMTLKNYI